MKRSVFLLIMLGALAIPIYLAHQHRDKNVQLATLMETEAEVLPLGPTVVKEEDDVSTIAMSTPEDEDEFNVEAKKQAVAELVDRALDFISQHSFERLCSVFTHGRDFIDGELYIFAYTMDGVCIAHGQSPELIWQNKYNARDAYGNYFIQDAIRQSEKGGGWISYQWRNATKVSYVKPFEKDGRKYFIGSGYYSHAKKDSVVKLVKAAVNHFNDVIADDQMNIDQVFGLLSYPMGRFLQGSLYLQAVDFQGMVMANGERPGLTGTNVLKDKDADGKLYNQEIIRKLREHPEGIWIEYSAKNTVKKVYAERVQDKKGHEYFIACGYYPYADRNALIELLRKGYDFMKRHGLTAAEKDFSDFNNHAYRFGDINLVVYDLKGICKANGTSPDFVGLNQWNVQDEDGRYYVREMIEKAEKGGGWIDFKLKNAFQSVYVEKIDLGNEHYIIGAGLYPVSRRETALLLSRSAANYLKTNSREKVFSELVNGATSFVRGDLSVFVLDFKGICRVYGDNYDLIWQDLLNVKDDDGKEYVKIFIDTVKRGAGQVSYTINGVRRIALVEMVEKDDISYVVGSGYFI